MAVRQLLTTGLAQLGIVPPDGSVDALVRYGDLLLARNQVMNLTAITAPDDVATLHFLDSAALLKAADFRGKRVLDVGTGAGFPGLALKLLEPSLSLTLLDSLGKRVDWLATVCADLGLDEVCCLHARAEEQGLAPDYRDSFDLVTSRALAPLRLLAELCMPFVSVGGYFLAMKSTDCGEEVSDAMKALRLMGGKVLSPYDYNIPHTDIIHRVVVVNKVVPTPRGYPRRWAKIQKAPL